MKTLSSLSNLSGRTALVTGGAGHLGQVMAAALAEAGANIAVADVRGDAAETVAGQLAERWHVRAAGFGVDLASEAEVVALPQRVVDVLGTLDVLVNNAAFVGTSNLPGWNEPFEKQTADTWRKAFEVNLTAVFELTQAAVPLLKKNGHGAIINIASIYGIVGPDFRLYEGLPMSNPAAYAASKGGVLQFTRWCSTVLAPEIRVNAITPGGIFRNQHPQFIDRYASRTPLKRMACEEDFMGAVVLLASDLSSYITGQNLVIDGGFSAW